MYTAVLVLFFLSGTGAFTLNPAVTADNLVQCEAQLILLGQRVDRLLPHFTYTRGPVVDRERLCLTADEVRNSPDLSDDQKVHVGEEA